MTDHEILQLYVALVPFLGEVLGSGCEIVVHDVTDPEHSLIAIRNGISGRVVGNPMTDLSLALAERAAYEEAGYLTNYTGYTQKGNFLSSTYYIKNEGRLIGLLCINKDMSAVQELNSTLSALLERFNLLEPQHSEYTEVLDNPISSVMHTRISEIIAQGGMPVARMSRSDKVKAVHRLRDDGVLMMKGAMADTAEQLCISVPTIYRYMKKASV